MKETRVLTGVLSNKVTSEELVGYVETEVVNNSTGIKLYDTMFENKLLRDVISMLCTKLNSMQVSTKKVSTREDIDYDSMLLRLEDANVDKIFDEATEEFTTILDCKLGISAEIETITNKDYMLLENILGIDKDYYKMRYILALLALNEK